MEVHPGYPVAVNHCVLVIDCGSRALIHLRWLPGVSVCVSGSPNELPKVRKPCVGWLGGWVPVLNVSFLDEEEHARLLLHTVVGKKRRASAVGCLGRA